jgi:ribose transport system substrate-binding protein
MKYASVIAAVGLMLTGAAEAADKKVIVWVPNGASDFWKLAEAGMHKAQKELPNFDLQWKYPERADAAIRRKATAMTRRDPCGAARARLT